jgi:hypothetical protein
MESEIRTARQRRPTLIGRRGRTAQILPIFTKGGYIDSPARNHPGNGNGRASGRQRSREVRPLVILRLLRAAWRPDTGGKEFPNTLLERPPPQTGRLACIRPAPTWPRRWPGKSNCRDDCQTRPPRCSGRRKEADSRQFRAVRLLTPAATTGCCNHLYRLRTPDLVRQPTENVETTWPQSTEERA